MPKLNCYTLFMEKEILALGIERQFTKEETIFEAGDEARGFYYLLTGETRIYKMDEDGQEVEIARVGPDGFIGEAIIFAQPAYPVFAQAVKECKTLYFPKERILKAIESSPKIALFFLQVLAQKCVVLNQRLETIGLKSIRQRLLHYLAGQCPRDGRCRFSLSTSKTDLAKQLGTISETLSRNFKALEDEGLIEVQGKEIVIKNCARMKEEII